MLRVAHTTECCARLLPTLQLQVSMVIGARSLMLLRASSTTTTLLQARQRGPCQQARRSSTHHRHDGLCRLMTVGRRGGPTSTPRTTRTSARNLNVLKYANIASAYHSSVPKAEADRFVHSVLLQAKTARQPASLRGPRDNVAFA